MKPIYNPLFIEEHEKLFNHLLNDLEWLQVTEARKEYFMSYEEISYTYGNGTAARTYTSKSFTPQVEELMAKLNNTFDCGYNVCFLNRYDNQKNQLGWHADDSPEMNMDHPIAVVSLGAVREIWWKDKDYKGEIPESNKQKLDSGSLFIMPSGFQKDNLHKIPRSDRPCGTRISLTFRNYLK